MIMWKQITLMAVALAGLIALDWQLTNLRRAEGDRSHGPAPFVSAEVFADRPVAAVKLVTANHSVLYVYHDGLWRCVGFNSAPAIGSRVSALTPALTAALGVVRSRNAKDAASYGFDEANSFRLTFCGQFVLQDRQGDVIQEIEVGKSIAPAGSGGCFARHAGSDEIWAIDVDFRAIIGGGNSPEAPPMIDPKLIPQEWQGFREGITAITIQRQNEPSLICRRTIATPGESQDTTPSKSTWTIDRDGIAQPGNDIKFYLFLQFLSRVEFLGIPGRRTPAELGLDQSRGSVRLETAGGKILELTLGGFGPHGGVIVHNDFSSTAYEMSRPAAAALLPALDDLSIPTESSPWDQWLQ